MFNGIDYSSDTATKPTQEMLYEMVNATVGDEQKGEDPTTHALELLIADKLGFDSALFLPSATMANQIAIQCLCEAGDQIVAAANSHILLSESGGPSVHANVMCSSIFTPSGVFTSDDISQQLPILHSIKSPRLKLVCVENTTNLGGGVAWNQKNLIDISQWANELNLKKHMDGSRLFNASIKTGLSVKDICAGFDTVTVCLSKGLGCPIGALLVFDKIYEKKMTRLKHLMGGAMRQTGILAAAGLYALENNVDRLAEDHENATLLANQLSNISGIQILNSTPETNIIVFKWVSSSMSSAEFYQKCLENNIRFSQIENNLFRAVTHLNISSLDIKNTIKIIKEFVVDTIKMPN